MRSTPKPFGFIHACLLLSCLVLGHPESDQVPGDTLTRFLSAIGIQSNSSHVRNIKVSGSQFRTRSIITTISLDTMDQTAVPYGSQVITYSYEKDCLKQRIDKIAGLGTLWVFARPGLEPMDYSVVVEDCDQGFAAVTKGSYSVFEPEAAPEGFLDGFLSAYMISDAYKWDPLLMDKIQTRNTFTVRYEPIEGGLLVPAVFDRTLNISVLLHPDTDLPLAIRSYEDHPFFGPSTNDLRVYDYVSADGIMIPRRYKVVYNNNRLITDFLADEVVVNGPIEEITFSPPTERQDVHIHVVDHTLTAEIGEKYANYL
ncbi:hypothetical protein C7974DRAFT_451764 [Boeremia exigua]|uniref:uncharacterized protein n=1 Tax=Boeremia exigua TaxID=749465 RepID=UPI001E8E14DE|nr:uncharacterized protein C7974DRAFT_451764 [Boeremia exigua]KAH6638391.1 hypothetical protein C7974DRAFT_451764 [Boeremia exigua]